MAVPKERERYSDADCLTWDEKDRIEIIDGEAFMMSPPNLTHQRISRRLTSQIDAFLQGKECELFYAPFGVRLFEKDGDRPEDVDTLVEPDLSVICDKNKLDDAGCKGAPDFIIEIMSPSNRRHDKVTKLNLYQRAGVREYWIVSPEMQTIEVFLLEDGFLKPKEFYGRDDQAKVTVLEGCQVDLSKVFEEG